MTNRYMGIIRFLLTTLFSVVFLVSATAQNKIFNGRVVDAANDLPLEFVTIFVTNTTIGTTTDEKGCFSISLPTGRHEIVVSMVGYGPILYPVDVSATENNSHIPVVFKLAQTETELSAVSVKAKRDQSWYDNLEVFKNNFLGRSVVASQCKLVNPESLIIVFDPTQSTLSVKSKDFMVIENTALGYKLSYLLVDFTYDFKEKYVSYLGYPRFEPMKGSKAKEKRWVKNRLKAYNGSVMHFNRVLREQQLEKNGFNLRRLIRLPNPNRPTEEQFEEARRQLDALGSNVILTEDHPLNKILAKSSLPKIIEKLDTAYVPYAGYITEQGGEVSLSFDGYFQIVYTGEKEEVGYVASTNPFKKRQPTFQTSVISMKEKPIVLDKSGSTSNPLALIVEDYWSWEKVGDMLPLDYTPPQQ